MYYDISILKAYPLLINGAIITLSITTIGVVFGFLLSTVLLAASLSKIKTISFLARLYIDTFRSIPLVMVILGFYLVAPKALNYFFNFTGDIRYQAAIITFVIFEAAYYSEILRSGINAISKNQIQAAKALGFTSQQIFRLILLPQAFRNSFPALLTQSIILFQDVSLVYVIGLPDFFGMAVKIGARDGEIVQSIIFASLVYLIVCFVLQRLANHLEQQHHPKIGKVR